MKLKLIALLSLLAISTSSFAALVEMTDEEMAGEAISIFPEGMSPELATLLLEGVRLNDAQKTALMKEINSLAVAVQTGRITEENFYGYYLNHLDKLQSIGIPHQILMYQATMVLRAQREAQLAADKLAMQRAIFQRFTSELTNLANSFRTNPNAVITININYILGGTYNYNMPSIPGTRR